MNKTIKILVVILSLQLLLTAGLFYTSGLISPPAEKQLLLNISKGDIKKIMLTGPGGKQVELEKIDGLWSLPNKDNFPANQAQINQLLDRLLETELGTKISKQKTSHDRLRVSETGFERKVSLFTKDNEPKIIYFGSAPSLRQSHARLSEEVDVHVVKFSANDIDIQSNDWIKKDIFVLQSKNIESVSFEKITLTRSSGFTDSNKKDVETSSKNSVSSWNAQGLSNKKLSNNAAIDFIKKIADMRINGIASKQDVEKVDKSKKTKKFTITMKNGSKITYNLSKVTGEEDFLLVTSQRSGTFRLPPLSGKDLINSSTTSFLAGEKEKNLDD